jgi:hypothetical protein
MPRETLTDPPSSQRAEWCAQAEEGETATAFIWGWPSRRAGSGRRCWDILVDRLPAQDLAARHDAEHICDIYTGALNHENQK